MKFLKDPKRFLDRNGYQCLPKANGQIIPCSNEKPSNSKRLIFNALFQIYLMWALDKDSIKKQSISRVRSG